MQNFLDLQGAGTGNEGDKNSSLHVDNKIGEK
jgi:hypothetical protein